MAAIYRGAAPILRANPQQSAVGVESRLQAVPAAA